MELAAIKQAIRFFYLFIFIVCCMEILQWEFVEQNWVLWCMWLAWILCLSQHVVASEPRDPDKHQHILQQAELTTTAAES